MKVSDLSTDELKSLIREAVEEKLMEILGNKLVAVQIDIETLAKIEQLLEDYALGQLIAKVEKDEALSLETAKAYYKQLPEDD